MSALRRASTLIMNAALLTLPLMPPAAPSASADAPPPIDASTRRSVVVRVADLLEKDYVFADTGAVYARTLRDDLKRKRYDAITDPFELARTLTERLNGVHMDAHLRIIGPDPASPLPPAEIEVPRGRRDVPETIVIDSLPPDQREAMRARQAAERRVNHYFRRLEILPGNIGYLAIDQIGMLAFSKATADAALAFLAETDAVILDLRGNPGGAEGLNRYLVSHFVPPGTPVHLYSRFTRPSGDTVATWSSRRDGDADLSGRPLFVLIDRGTGSAAENISFTLQGLRLGTLVGETTAGGAHSSVQVGLPGGLRMILPISRVFNPRTGRDWEGVGVIPDVACGADSALAVAHGLAVDSLLARGPDPAQRGRLEQARALYRARAGGPGGGTGATAAGLSGDDYTGTWGLRKIWVDAGKLWLQRQDDPRAPRLELIPTGRDEFMVERANRPVRFERDAAGHVVRMRLQTPLDTWEVVERK